MSTIDLDHIPLLASLVGPSNFETWKRGITQVLCSEGLWGHVSADINPYSPFPIELTPATPTVASTQEELQAFRAWWIADSRAPTIIERRIRPVTLLLLPGGVVTTAREVWEALGGLYGRKDVMGQFGLRDYLASVRLKDHCDN